MRIAIKVSTRGFELLVRPGFAVFGPWESWRRL